MTDIEALRGRANELGVEWSYWDNEGRYHESDMEAVRRVVEVLEADAVTGPRNLEPVIVGSPASIPVGEGVDQVRLALADGTELELEVSDGAVSFSDVLPIGNHRLSLTGPGLDESTTIVVAPDRMPSSVALAGRTGVFAPAYALWEHDSPLPSFEQLRGLSEALPGLGVDLLVTLPLYAGFLDEPFDPSPYAPVSRLHWNEVYLSDPGLPEADVPPMIDLVDWQVLARRRRRQLLDVAEALAAGSDPVLSARIDHWVDEHPDVGDYARFRATVAVDPTDQTRRRPVVEASHRLAQFLADAKLSELESGGAAAFALDLPIGSHPAGYETWAYPDLWAPAMAVGAPPDMLFEGGQNWGFPPQLPGAARRTGYALWRKIIGHCGRHASMLRIDHVLGVHRLWWIPDGMDARSGVYVRYPRHELTAAIAAEAALANTTVVGEDLGTVPQEMIDLLEQWAMLGLFAEEMHMSGPELAPVPARSVAAVRTHDMPAFAALCRDTDMEPYRARLEAELGHPVVGTPAALLDAVLTRLARSDAYVVVADLDDLLGETAPHNVPGLVSPTTWRRRLREPTSVTLQDPQVRAHLEVLTAR